MIRQRGHSRLRRQNGFGGIATLRLSAERGFTLMEIVVVVIIVSALFVVTMPSLRGVNENNRLRASVRELTNLMKYSRTEAVFNARTTQVFLDTENHEFWLDLRRPEDDKSKRRGLKTTMEHKRELEKNVSFEAVNAIEKNILKDGVIAIDFHPDGTASPALIALKNDRGTRYTIEVMKSTGIVEITKADLDTVAEQQASLQHPLPDNYYENMMSDTGTW